MDAAGAVDAQNAPTAPWKPPRTRFPTAPTRITNALTNKISDTPDDEPLHTIHQPGTLKLISRPAGFLGHLDVVEHRGFWKTGADIDRLHFHHDSVLDDEVDAIGRRNRVPYT